VEKDIKFQIKGGDGWYSKTCRDYASGTETPSRNKLWLTEHSCITISEVFTRAITVIIISTIPCNALSWAARRGEDREGLPTSPDWEFV